MDIYLADASDAGGGIMLFLILIGLFIWAIVRGVSAIGKASAYVNGLASQIADPTDKSLFLNIYQTEGPKDAAVAWALTIFLSPTISYIYQGKWGLAVIALLTLQGFLVWWVVSWFTMPFEVMSLNRRLADKAFNQLIISRTHAAPPMPSLKIVG